MNDKIEIGSKVVYKDRVREVRDTGFPNIVLLEGFTLWVSSAECLPVIEGPPSDDADGTWRTLDEAGNVYTWDETDLCGVDWDRFGVRYSWRIPDTDVSSLLSDQNEVTAERRTINAQADRIKEQNAELAELSRKYEQALEREREKERARKALEDHCRRAIVGPDGAELERLRQIEKHVALILDRAGRPWRGNPNELRGLTLPRRGEIVVDADYHQRLLDAQVKLTADLAKARAKAQSWRKRYESEYGINNLAKLRGAIEDCKSQIVHQGYANHGSLFDALKETE